MYSTNGKTSKISPGIQFFRQNPPPNIEFASGSTFDFGAVACTLDFPAEPEDFLVELMPSNSQVNGNFQN
jgi:hypothetical protein